MTLTNEQVIGLVTKIENAADADKRLAALQGLEAALDGAPEIPDSDAVVQILKISVRNANQAVSAAALAFLPSLFTSLAAPSVAQGRILPSSVAHVRSAVTHLMPILIEKLGDQKERVREASRKALVQLGLSSFTVSPPPEANSGAGGLRKGKDLETPLMIFERLLRENALGAKAARVKEQDRFPVKLLLPSLVTLLSDADPSVREGSKNSLVSLFAHATAAAKAGLKKELERQDVRKATMDAIVKEVLAGPSAIPVPSANAGPSLAAASTAATQAAVVKAASGQGVTGAAAIGAGEDDVPPVYAASRSDLDRTFTSMMPHFEGKETEHNWLSREQSILKIRGLLKTGAHVTYKTAFVDGIKHVHEGILKALVSLRTTMSIHACSLLGELARAVGDSLDSLADTFLNALLRLAGLTKKMVAASTQAAARDFFIYVPFKHSFATMLSVTMQEKTPSSRQAAIEHLCTLWQYQGINRKHALESQNSMSLLESALKRALSDQNKDVRAKARETFWVFHAIWPNHASVILEAADAVTKKAILGSVPPPGTVLLLTADKSSVNGAVAQQVAAPAMVSAAHQQLAATAAPKKPAFSQSSGPTTAEYGIGVAAKTREISSVSSTASSVASAPAATGEGASTAASAPKRRAVGPSAALMAAKREAQAKMRASAAADRDRQANEGANGPGQEAGDDSEAGDWMAEIPSNTAKPGLASRSASSSAFMPSRARSPPASQRSNAAMPTSPPRFVPKYGHDDLASPPKKVSHVRSFSQRSTEEALPSRIPAPISPFASPRSSDSPRLGTAAMPVSRNGHGSGDNARLPRPSADLVALAAAEDDDVSHLLSMSGPDSSMDLMIFSSSSPERPPGKGQLEPILTSTPDQTLSALAPPLQPAILSGSKPEEPSNAEDVSQSLDEFTIEPADESVPVDETIVHKQVEQQEDSLPAEEATPEAKDDNTMAQSSMGGASTAEAGADSTVEAPRANASSTATPAREVASPRGLGLSESSISDALERTNISRSSAKVSAAAAERDSRRSSVSSTASGPLHGLGKFSRPGSASAHQSRIPSPPPGHTSPRPEFDARPLNSAEGRPSAAVSTFLRRANRLEQGSPIRSKPEAAEWVAAIRDGSADLRTYKRLLKLTIEFRISGPGASHHGDQLLSPGRDASGVLRGPGNGALGLERMGEDEGSEEAAGMRAWEDGNLFDNLFVAICGSLQAPPKNEDLRMACFALLHRLVENQFPMFTTTGRELDLLALLFQIKKDGRRGKQVLDACEAILISWSGLTDPMLGLGAVMNNLKTTADTIGHGTGRSVVSPLPDTNGNANGNGTASASGSIEDESSVRTLVMGLKVLARVLVRLPGEVIEEELSRAKDVLRMTLTHTNVELRRTAIETLVAANRQINDAASIFALVGPLPASQQDLLMYYFHKAGQQ
ncbi:suppressor of tub2 mutation [Tilletia horrida]|uniref:Suppressor of tub2 mutation n=1 Tax=Tilletia horrida TaxID=155126 RepID=A0AAN6GVH6_9BASI|nr:suppressor of tub2 mutation [Tilletia horrida]KAK0569645.1 suppressor of tub2 mutation [Tilletia horrida]